MGAALLTPAVPPYPEGWIDATAGFNLRYNDTIFTPVPIKSSRYTYLNSKTIFWSCTWTMPTGVSGNFIIGIDLPLPGKAFSAATMAIGSAGMVRPGSWLAAGIVVRANNNGAGQRALFTPQYPAANLWGDASQAGATNWLPGDQYWFTATYELA